MIITKEFIWFHLGKTGGDMFHYLMNKYYKGDIIFQHDVKDENKHLNVVPSKYNHIKKYIIGFRRLPSWIVSHNRHQLKYACSHMGYKKIIEKTKNNQIVFKDKHCSPDSFLRDYIHSSMIDRVSFIRQEYLLHDFVKIVGKYLGENKKIIELEKDTIKNENATTKEIILTKENKDLLYASNSFWTNIENQIY